MDYFGRMLIKSRHSQVKRCRCVFKCLAVQAVHIAIAHNLRTDSFIQAFTRFVGGRGSQTNLKSLEHLSPERIDNCLKRCGKSGTSILRIQVKLDVWESMICLIHKILRSLLGCQEVDDETVLNNPNGRS